jgi:hypothetical protein
MACVRKYRGSWVVDWRDPTGKRFIEAAEDKEAAENRLAEVIKSGKAPASKRLTFKEYGEWWLENCAKSAIKKAPTRSMNRFSKSTSTRLLVQSPS